MKLIDNAVNAAKALVGKPMGRETYPDDGGKRTPDDVVRETLELVGQLKQESAEYIQSCGDGEKSIRDEWIDNANRFVGNFGMDGVSGDVATSRAENFRVINGRAINSGRLGLKRAFLMRTQNSVMANTASATATPVYGRLAPVEYGEEDVWFLTPRGGRIVQGAIEDATDQRRMELEALTDEASNLAATAEDVNESLDAAVSAEQAHHLLKTVEQDTAAEWGGLSIDQYSGEYGPSMPLNEDQYMLLAQKAEMGEIPLRDTDFIAMTDRFISQRAQQVCDVLTDRANMPIYWLMYALNSNITGHACGEFEWHTAGRFRHGFTFNISHPMNVFTDPCHWDMRFRNYHVEEEIVPLDRLLAKWPDQAEELKAAAREGQQFSEDGTTLGGTSENVNFQRKMVTVTTAWVRDQMVPLSPEDAVADGFVTEKPVFTDQESMQPAYDDETGEPLKRYVLAETGEEVEPADEVGHGTNWPDGLGLRQIVCVRSANLVLQDIRCPYPEIPRVWSLNIPRPDGSPFGQGEPVRLKHIDEIINYTLSMLVNYLASLGFPTCLWPKTLMQRLRAAGVALNLRPNMHIPIEDAQWVELMRAGGTDRLKFKAEPLPASYVNFLEMMLKEHDTVSNNVPVRQGREPFSGASGKTIAALQEGAESSLSIKSRLLEQAVIDFYRLLIHAIVNWLPESEWAKILNRYELPVIREVIKRVRQTQWDVTVKVSSGRGKDEEQDKEMAVALYDKRLLSDEDTLQRIGEDDPQGTAKKAREYWSPATPEGQADPAQAQQN